MRDPVPVAWVGLFRLQLDFRIQTFFREAIQMALRCILSVNSYLSGFSLYKYTGLTQAVASNVTQQYCRVFSGL